MLAGTTTLTATNTYTGPTTVNAGALIVNGSIAPSSLTTVNSGAALIGSGTVGSTVVNAGGFLVPGPVGAPGTMTVTGNLAFQPGAFYIVQVNPTTASTTNVSGNAALAGTVGAIFLPGSYLSRSYTILTAAGGLTGTYNALSTAGLPANFGTSLNYVGNTVVLNLMAHLVPPEITPPPVITPPIPPVPGLPPLPAQPPQGPFTQNEINVGRAIDNFFNNGGTLPPAFGSLYSLTGGNLTNALTQLSGELATGSQQTTFDAMNIFLGLLTDPFIAGRGDPVSGSTGALPFGEENDSANAYAANDKTRTQSERDAYAAIYRKAPVKADPFVQRWSVWTAFFGGTQTTDGNATLGSNTATSHVYGGAVGADYRFSPYTIAGFALAGGGTNFSVCQWIGKRTIRPVPGWRLRAPQRRPGLSLSSTRLRLAGHHHRPHRHCRRRGSVARKVQRQCMVRARRKRLSFCRARIGDGHHALRRGTVHHLRSACLYRAGGRRRQHLCARLRRKECHGLAHRTRLAQR